MSHNVILHVLYKVNAICVYAAVYEMDTEQRNRLRCVNENRKKRKRLRWQAANHGCHCFDRAFLLAGACKRLRLNVNRASEPIK